MYRRQAVQECLDVIGVLRGYRPPEPGETWSTPAASERRMLAQVNAIVALGPDALGQVVELALNVDVPDPSRVFASLFVLGCTAGAAWVEPGREVFAQAARRDIAEAAAAVEAWGLSPNPGVDSVLQELCAHEHPRVRAAAVRASAFRGTLPEGHWQAAMNDDELDVVLAAMPAGLGSFDRESCERTLERWYRSEHASVARPALRAGATLRLPSARAAAIEIVRRDAAWADAAIALAMSGQLGDVRLLRGVLAGPMVRAGIGASAVLGSVDLVPDLLALLRSADVADDVSILARQAVATITGIPAMDVDGETLEGLWHERSSAFSQRVRYRAGEPLTPALLLRGLRAPQSSRRDRQAAYAELLTLSETAAPRFSPFDFVGVQLDSLASLERWLSRGQHDAPMGAI